MDLWQGLGLDMDMHRVITLVGAGGKTSTMYRLAWEARRAGRRVILTTTTHIRPHPRIFLTGNADPVHLRRCLDRYGVITLGRRGQGHGPSGPKGPVSTALCGPAELEACREAADVVIIEGDGARLRPLKVPARWEPVILPGSNAIVALAGMDALGEPVEQVVHRSELACRLLGKAPTAPVTTDDVVTILSSPLGGRKSVPTQMPYRCILNKAEGFSRLARAREIQSALAERGILALATSFLPACRGGNTWF